MSLAQLSHLKHISAAALLSLMDQMKNTPPNWGQSHDPCGASWDGVTCNNNSRVTEL